MADVDDLDLILRRARFPSGPELVPILTVSDVLSWMAPAERAEWLLEPCEALDGAMPAETLRHDVDRVLAAAVVERAVRVMGDRGMAQDWLVRPSMLLGDRRPADMLGTAEGRREVLDLLARGEAGFVV